MWTIVFFLWLAPLGYFVFMLVREGSAVAAQSGASKALFGDNREIRLTPTMSLEFAVFAVLFFLAGIVEGLVLANLGSLWLVLVPLATGVGAALLLVQWVRWGERETLHSRSTARMRARQTPRPGMLPR